MLRPLDARGFGQGKPQVEDGPSPFCLGVVRGGGERTPLYMCVHTWKKEDFKVVGKKVVEVLPKLPKGTALVSTMTDGRQTGAWCVYDTDQPAEVKAFLDKSVPEMTSEMIPVLQFFPPGPDIYKIVHLLSS